MNEFYKAVEKVKDTIMLTGLIKTVTIGDTTDIDLNRKGDYALGHIIIGENRIEEANTNVSYQSFEVILCDLVDLSLENWMDVLNTMNVAGSQVVRVLDNEDFINGSATMEAFKERFEMGLAGWVLKLS